MQYMGQIVISQTVFVYRHGHSSCCRVLLEFFAPLMPRTNKDETPADLARAAGKEEVALFLDTCSHSQFAPESQREQFLHGLISRQVNIDSRYVVLLDCSAWC